VGLRADLDKCGKSRPPTGIRSPDRPARSESLYRLSYPGLSCRTATSTKFLTASALFTTAEINYCVSYWSPKLLDVEYGVSVAATSEVRDSLYSYNRFNLLKPSGFFTFHQV
jgi:hypothetical protein